jgi:uncharacterized RDD family membrane protein YckC
LWFFTTVIACAHFVTYVVVMQLSERMPLVTPEGVALELPLAGLGSRITAALADIVLQIILLTGFFWIAGTFSSSQDREGLYLQAIVGVTIFLMLFVYPVLFELAWSGQTPGKRLTGLRVLTVHGGPIDAKSSAIRNLVRVIDMMPTLGLFGMLSIGFSKTNQRLGDFASGTIVIVEPSLQAKARKSLRSKVFGDRPSKRSRRKAQVAVPGFTPSSLATSSALWDVTAVSKNDIGAVRTFLARRETLPPDVRTRLAAQFASALRSKSAGVSPGLDDEAFLTQLVAVKDARR